MRKNTASTGETGSKVETKADTEAIVSKLKSNIPILSQIDAVSKLIGTEFSRGKKRLSEQVADFFKGKGNIITREGFGDIVLDERSIHSDIAHGIGRAKAITFAAVPDVIANGTQIDSQKNWKGRGKDSYVFAAPVKIGDKTTYVAAVVLSGDNSRFYLHEVVDENGDIIFRKNDAPETIKTGVPQKNEFPGSSSAPLIDPTIPQNGAGVNPNVTTGGAQNESNEAGPRDKTGPEGSTGAAPRGFSAPTQGPMVETQNKTATESLFLNDGEIIRRAWRPAGTCGIRWGWSRGPF